MRATRMLIIAAIVALVAAACGGGDSTSTSLAATGASDSVTPTTVPLSSVPSDYVGYLHQPTACGADRPDPAIDMKFDAPGEVDVPEGTTVTLNTSCGPIEIAVDPATAPETVNSFVFLAEEGYFDGTVSHRIVPGFMMQAGDPTATGFGGPGYALPDELPATAAYTRGVVAMANSGPNSAGSQFFIMFGEADWLPPQYSVFGEVTSGFEVLDRIEEIPLGRGPGSADPNPSTPLESLFIESVTVNR